MTRSRPRIAIPEPTSIDPAYNQRAWPQYAHAVESSGGEAVPIPLSESQATLARLASLCVGVLLPGSRADVDPEKYGERPSAECGPKDPAREAADELLLQDAFNLHKPVLGICYGLQSLNVWRNGTLIQHLGPGLMDHAPGRGVVEAHALTIEGGSRLAAILEAAADTHRNRGGYVVPVNSSHHQAVAEPGDHLRVVARSAADGVIEAVEDPSAAFTLGVQWHPERTYGVSAASRKVFDAFIAAAAAWQPRRVRESVAP